MMARPPQKQECWTWATAVIGLLGALLATQSAVGQTTEAGRRAVQGAAYMNAQGQIVKGGVVIIDGEMIAEVVDQPPAELPVDVYPGAVLCPGLIDCHSALGASGGLSERQAAFEPRVNARDAFDRYARQLRQALAAGVTTFALAPDDKDLVGGRIAICQTAGPDGQPRLLSDAGPFKLSLSPEILRPEREPTSRSGALGMLRKALETGRSRSSSDRDDPWPAFAGGQLCGFVTAPSGADVLAGLELAHDYGLRLVLIHTIDARRVAEQVAGHVAGVVVGPLDLGSDQRAAVAAGLFARQGTPVGIAGGLPTAPADSLRMGAAVAARAGLAPAAARRAITTVPAELLSVGDRIGKLDAGHQADVVVCSGDPLDLRSRVLAVYVAGRRVYAISPGQSPGEAP